MGRQLLRLPLLARPNLNRMVGGFSVILVAMALIRRPWTVSNRPLLLPSWPGWRPPGTRRTPLRIWFSLRE